MQILSGEILVKIAIVLKVAFDITGFITGFHLIMALIKLLMDPASFFKNDSPWHYNSMMVFFLIAVGYFTCSEIVKNWKMFFEVRRLQEERRNIRESKNE